MAHLNNLSSLSNQEKLLLKNAAIKISYKNFGLLKHATQCACYYCCTTFSPLRIREWADNGLTALCPNCNIDAVLSDAATNISFNQRTLKAINKITFLS